MIKIKRNYIIAIIVLLTFASLIIYRVTINGSSSHKQEMAQEVTEYLYSKEYKPEDIESVEGMYSLKEESDVSKYSALVKFKSDDQKKYIYVKRFSTQEISQEGELYIKK